jgi:hypothetical protein
VAASLLLSLGLGLYPAVGADELLPVVATLAVLGVVFIAAALLRWTRLVAAALVCLGGEYLLTEAAGSVTTLSIVAYAAGPVVLCELVLWAAQLRVAARVDASVVFAWLRRLVLLAIGSAVLALAVLAATGLQMKGSLTVTIVGAVAVVVLVALPLLLMRGRSRRVR